jgi:FdhD protein
MSQVVKEVNIRKYKLGTEQNIADLVIEEVPLTLFLNGKELVTLLCSPEFLDELTLGFLVAEGFVAQNTVVNKVKINEKEGTAEVEAEGTNLIAEKTFMKRYITTACGRGTSFYNVMDSIGTGVSESPFTISTEEMAALMKQMQGRSSLYKTTGGTHAAALCTRSDIVAFREDIGRHNAIDKILGRCYMDKTDTTDMVLLTTGRISSEMSIKAARMGISVLASRSAPTGLAVYLAEQSKVTLLGFLRGSHMNVYTHPERVKM